ncbi:metallophosphoesterase [Aliiglaciecola sp. 3_MG-2023]|uniref:metallophosphoesterase family protein n=1 Tax=Aliiglaciecola sp. 3_MG-2023 TaxID=3062644 RepID=UPI0026E1E3A7|nr:metallophosphoesterase [Aliiglaciecola sp. 3_MG-2023]MDO6692541.1 metallophosphoesterase [Aliiglaciecola sp. 3_MG-2023]
MIRINQFIKTGTCLALVLALSACEDEKTVVEVVEVEVPVIVEVPVEEPEPEPIVKSTNQFKIGLLPDTQGGSDSEGQAHVSMHPMSELLKHQAAADVDMVIAVGDLTDGGSDIEFAEWRSVADSYSQQGIEFLPLMGNHETSYAYTYNWINNMKHFIPEDATHMPSYEWVNYYVVRENVLIFALAYYNLPIAFDWIKETVLANEDKVDHIVVASHDGLVGAKYGQTIEQIVDGTKDDDWVYDVQPKIRDFFSEYDVIYVQGHEHQYQRSLITAKTTLTTYPSSSTPTGGNYRMDMYTQIMTGNASYKGYEFRFGERDLVQMIVSQKNQTNASAEDSGFDVNSSILTFENDRVDYQSYFATHNATSNDADQAFTAEWKLMDQFSRTTNRCEMIVYPNAIHEETRPVMVLQPNYISNECYAEDGSYARLAGGTNDTFNRTDTRTRDMSFTPGFTRSESLNDLVRLAYQWLFQVHERWSPNLNAAYRVVPDYDNDEMIIPETTIDLKEHVTLSWTAATDETSSDILIISGTQNQTGMYQDDYGLEKDIEVDAGLAYSLSGPDLGSLEEGEGKPAVSLPATATKSWDISDAVSDQYAVEFVVPESIDVTTVQLASKSDAWAAIAPAACVIEGGWDDTFLTTPPTRETECSDYPLVGFDADLGNLWWVVLNSDAEIALIAK